ncbi:hypothetical protein [Bacillus thuringiensis]|uniref:hypothetical protein n=1 Tax=Bacillus thuringiensis TaxID=1428 RepID=UPI000BFC3935|nr:hypothetical protein [Bacillus thuringiensis]PGT89917.1 hypothetical protein COD17_09205 [Bacillus thuringiensis]
MSKWNTVKLNINGLEFETPTYWMEGTGKWRDHDGAEYSIVGVSYPPQASGKHVYIDSNDGSASYRALDDGESLSFQATSCAKEKSIW